MKEKTYSAKRRFVGGGSYIYRNRNIERLDGKWWFMHSTGRYYTSTLSTAKFLIDLDIERVGA